MEKNERTHNMIDKTIKLTGEYPSDFKPTLSVKEIHKHFYAHGFYEARMISGSKSFYRKEYLDDLIVFNFFIILTICNTNDFISSPLL